MDELNEQCRIEGLKINKSRTDVKGVTKSRERLAVNINIEGVAIKQVGKFRYLGSLVSEDGRCDEEIRARRAMGKANFGKMRNVLTNLGLNIQLRVRLVKSYIRAGMLYGCESWTITAQLRRR